jgi:hypothetical protein
VYGVDRNYRNFGVTIEIGWRFKPRGGKEPGSSAGLEGASNKTINDTF